MKINLRSILQYTLIAAALTFFPPQFVHAKPKTENLARLKTEKLEQKLTPLQFFKKENLEYFKRKDINISFEYLQGLISIQDKQGKSIFTEEDIMNLLFKRNEFGNLLEIRKFPIKYLQDLAEIKDEKGDLAFNGKDVVGLAIGKVPLEYAQDFAAKKKDMPGITGFKIRRLYQLKFDKENAFKFEDTFKPNAIFVYPTRDPVASFETLHSIIFFEIMQKHYDIRLVIAENENDLYRAIDKTPNVELLFLAGHGFKQRMLLGDQACSDIPEKDKERYQIDFSDTELSAYLKKLNPDAIIFLNSCSLAEGGKKAKNLANFIMNHADGRKVISSEIPFSSREIKVKSIYPFDAKIILFGRDFTYTNK